MVSSIHWQVQQLIQMSEDSARFLTQCLAKEERLVSFKKHVTEQMSHDLLFRSRYSKRKGCNNQRETWSILMANGNPSQSSDQPYSKKRKCNSDVSRLMKTFHGEQWWENDPRSNEEKLSMDQGRLNDIRGKCCSISSNNGDESNDDSREKLETSKELIIEPKSSQMERKSVYIPTPWGILPAYTFRRYRPETDQWCVLVQLKSHLVPSMKHARAGRLDLHDSDASNRLKDEFGQVIPYIGELVEEAGEYFRKFNWIARRCLYCNMLINPDASEANRHLQGKRDKVSGAWIHSDCPGRSMQGENPWEPPRKFPASKLVQIDVDARRGIYFIE